MRFVVALLMIGLAASSSSLAVAQDDAPATRARRDDVRLRVGVLFGGAVLHSEAMYGSWEMVVTETGTGGSCCSNARTEGWRSVGEAGRALLGGLGFVTFEVGVQSDYVAGYLLTRTGMGYGGAPILVSALVLETTLGDFFHLGVGPSLDVVSRFFNATPYSTEVLTNTLRERVTRHTYIGPGAPRQSYDSSEWVVAPGVEVRLGFATGGGPYERRGFVFSPFVHVTVPSNGLLVLAGLEMGFQSY